MTQGWMLSAAAAIGVAVGALLQQAAPVPPASVPAQQEPPIIVTAPRDQPDIVVTGERPMIRGGLWRFERSGTLSFGSSTGTGTGSGERLSVPFRFTLCLPDGGLEDMLHRVAGERSAMPTAPKCGKLRMRVGGGKVTGSRSCTIIGPLLVQNTLLDLSGRYDDKALRINYLNEVLHDGVERGGGAGWSGQRPRGDRWRVIATRTGDCPLEPALDQKTMDEATFSLFDPGATD